MGVTPVAAKLKLRPPQSTTYAVPTPKQSSAHQSTVAFPTPKQSIPRPLTTTMPSIARPPAAAQTPIHGTPRKPTTTLPSFRALGPPPGPSGVPNSRPASPDQSTLSRHSQLRSDRSASTSLHRQRLNHRQRHGGYHGVTSSHHKIALAGAWLGFWNNIPGSL